MSRFPKPVYAGIKLEQKTLEILFRSRKKILFEKKLSVGTDPASSLLAHIRNLTKKHKVVFIGAGIYKNKLAEEAAATLWTYENISPFILKIKNLDKLSTFAKNQFDIKGSYIAKTNKANQVTTPFLVPLKDYEKITSPYVFRNILNYADKIKGKKITYISATPQGGGVALMRHALMRFYKLIGVNANWYVMKDSPKFFYITKNKFHNVFQKVNADGVSLNEKDKKLYNSWSKINYNFLKKVIRNSDLVVIDDPQPAGLIPLIKDDFPNKPIIFRLHIHMLAHLADQSDTEQSISWSFLYEKIKSSNLFVFHPIKSFVPKILDKEKTVMMGAVLDPLDGLNKHLSEKQQSYYLGLLNKFLTKSGQTAIDETKPIITQIARFDPSKGIPDLLDSFYKLRKRMDSIDNVNKPQLIIAGNSSIDDPDGVSIYNLAMSIVSDKKYESIRQDIKILRIPHNDFLLNTILRISTIYVQLSHKEGFEDKITGGLMKGKPVVIYRAGGMPLQVREGKNGFLADVGDTNTVASHLHNLLTNKKLYNRMKMSAIEDINEDMNTQFNALYWMYLFDELLNNERIDFEFKKLSDIIFPNFDIVLA